MLVVKPTALQAAATVHDTADRLLSGDPAGLAVGSTVHFVPFQASAKVISRPSLFPYSPTAVQAVAEVHDTPDRESPVSPDGLLVG